MSEIPTPLDLTSELDTDCTNGNPWCVYGEPHEHGFACDKSCPCWEHLTA